MAITAGVLIKAALQDLGVLGSGEAAQGSDMADGLTRLQLMLAGWALDPLTVVQTDRHEFPITPGKGTYTIGPTLDFDVARPVGQASIVGAGIMLTSATPPVEVPRAVLTYDAYQRIAVKTLTNPLFTTVFYRPGSTQRVPLGAPMPPHGIDYGEVLLWPVPLEANPLVLYIERVLPLFENLTTSYPVPDGYVAAIQYNLTVAMAPMFQVEPSPLIVRAAARTFASMKRNNYQFIDVGVDPMFTMQTPGPGYNIDTGGTQRRG